MDDNDIQWLFDDCDPEGWTFKFPGGVHRNGAQNPAYLQWRFLVWAI